MAELEKIAVICPSCKEPAKTGFNADIGAYCRLACARKTNGYKTKCPNCGAWILWREAKLIPERLMRKGPEI